MKLNYEYFNKEVMKFREMLGDRRLTVEQVSAALGGLLTVYINTLYKNKEEEKRAEHLISMITIEHDKRLALRLQYGI